MVSAYWYECYDVSIPSALVTLLYSRTNRYYVVYVFEGAGLTGRRANLIADSVQYVLNVCFTGKIDTL